MPRDHHLGGIIVIRGLADLALSGFGGHLGGGGEIQPQQGGHGPDPDRNGGLHRLAAQAQKAGGIRKAERAGGAKG